MKFNTAKWIRFSILTGALVASFSGCSTRGSTEIIPGASTNNQSQNGQTATVATLAQAATPKFDAIVKNADGSLNMMSEDAASKYCLGKKMRLPTIRELALLATSEGANGISSSDASQPDLTHVQVMDANEKVTDDFYYDASGYEPATPPETQDEWLWSSSITHEKDGDYAYYFSVSMGFISADLPSATHAVRCLIPAANH